MLEVGGLVGKDGAKRPCFFSLAFLDTASVLVSGQLVMAITPTATSVSDRASRIHWTAC